MKQLSSALDLIADVFRVVAIDQRGYNTSSKPRGVKNYTVEKLVDDVSQLITALGKYTCRHESPIMSGIMSDLLFWALIYLAYLSGVFFSRYLQIKIV